MCIFGGGGGSSSSKAADGPVSKGPSDQKNVTRDDSIIATKTVGGVQAERDPLGRGAKNGGGGVGSARRRKGGYGTLLTAGDTDTSGKKTLLGA
jgi:hypothetical protein